MLTSNKLNQKVDNIQSTLDPRVAKESAVIRSLIASLSATNAELAALRARVAELEENK